MHEHIYELKTLVNDEGVILHREMKNIEWTHLLGLISIKYYVEDRRPDLTPEEYPNKYKHYIILSVFGQKYRWTFRSSNNGEDMPYGRSEE